MKHKKFFYTAFSIILLFSIFLFSRCQNEYSESANRHNNSPHYVGKEACTECHVTEYNEWKGSDHDLAMDYANDTTVLGDFNNATLVRNGQEHKCYKKNNHFFVYTDGEDGQMHEYQVKYVFGHYPLQNYLVEFPGGRLQTLALTWNSKDHNWYYMPDSVYQGMNVDHNNWLHWTNQAQNWNSMCADCHSTDLKKGYDIKTDTYHTTWSEIDVSCEACHGPGSEHIAWTEESAEGQKEYKNYGLVVQTSHIDNHKFVDLCARCHARRVAYSDYIPGAPSIYDHINPQLPIEPYYYIDGQIKEEDYVYGSFTQSKMYMHDVQCNNCHNMHSGKVLYDDNRLCTQCHLADDYDTPAHTHHKGFGEPGEAVVSAAGVKFEVGSGTQCINCHMHGANFMGVDYRRDHSFRIPRPDLSEKLGTPNACNQCHTDRSNQWAQSYIVKWFGISRHYQFGLAFDAANKGDKHAEERLRGIIRDDLYPAPVRSSAIDYLDVYDTLNKDLLLASLEAPDPSVRIESVRRIPLDSQETLDKLLGLLYDKTKAVRMEVFTRLMTLDTSLIPPSFKAAFNKADKEYLESLLYNADFPGGKYNLGNYYYAKNNLETAEKYYLTAVEQDDEMTAAKLNLAHLYSTMNQPLKAEALLKNYVAANPEDGMGYYNYGLILSENKKYEQSLKALLKASELMPGNARIDHNIAMLYEYFKNTSLSEKYLKSTIAKDPGNFSYYVDLFSFYMKTKQFSRAKELTNRMIIRFPDNAEMQQLQQVLEQAGM